MPRRAGAPTDNSRAEARVAHICVLWIRGSSIRTNFLAISRWRAFSFDQCVIWSFEFVATRRNLLNAAIRIEPSKPAWPILCSPAVLLRALKIPRSYKYVHISKFYRTPSLSNVAISIEVASACYLNTLPRQNHMFRSARHGNIFIIQSI